MSIAVFTSFDQLTDQTATLCRGDRHGLSGRHNDSAGPVFRRWPVCAAAANPIVCDGYGRHDMRYFAATAY